LATPFSSNLRHFFSLRHKDSSFFPPIFRLLLGNRRFFFSRQSLKPRTRVVPPGDMVRSFSHWFLLSFAIFALARLFLLIVKRALFFLLADPTFLLWRSGCVFFPFCFFSPGVTQTLPRHNPLCLRRFPRRADSLSPSIAAPAPGPLAHSIPPPLSWFPNLLTPLSLHRLSFCIF